MKLIWACAIDNLGMAVMSLQYFYFTEMEYNLWSASNQLCQKYGQTKLNLNPYGVDMVFENAEEL